MTAIRKFCIGLIVAAVAAAQNVTPQAPLAVLEQAVHQKTADWETLALGLDATIRGLLPCDPKAAAAITELSKASDARIAALSAYLQEAGREAVLQTAAARRLLAAVQPLGTDLSSEKTDVAQEHTGVSGQIAALTDSAQRRPSFNGPQETLRRIAALEQQRSDAVDSGINHDEATGEAARGLLAKLEDREAALSGVQAAFETESVRWSAYYATRLARAQAECTVTKPLSTAPARGKQK